MISKHKIVLHPKMARFGYLKTKQKNSLWVSYAIEYVITSDFFMEKLHVKLKMH